MSASQSQHAYYPATLSARHRHLLLTNPGPEHASINHPTRAPGPAGAGASAKTVPRSAVRRVNGSGRPCSEYSTAAGLEADLGDGMRRENGVEERQGGVQEAQQHQMTAAAVVFLCVSLLGMGGGVIGRAAA